MHLTEDELQKVAISIKNLTSIGNFFTGTMPKAFGAVRSGAEAIGLTAANANKAGLISGAVGAAGGVFSTPKTDDPAADTRSKIFRGAVGAAGGFFGGKALANKMPTFGQHYEAAFKPVGEKALQLAGDKNLSSSMRSQHFTDFVSKQLNPKVTKPAGMDASAKNFFGMGAEVKAQGQVMNPDLPFGAKLVGDLARGSREIRTRGVVQGVSNTLKRNWHENTFFDKKVGDNTYRFKRSGVGKIVAPALGSGIGIGATEALTVRNDDGSKPTLGKRLRTGAKSTLTWGMAPHLMLGKMTAYDIPKSVISGQE